jgi:hypothetical protein
MGFADPVWSAGIPARMSAQRELPSGPVGQACGQDARAPFRRTLSALEPDVEGLASRDLFGQIDRVIS